VKHIGEKCFDFGGGFAQVSGKKNLPVDKSRTTTTIFIWTQSLSLGFADPAPFTQESRQ